MSLKKPRWEEKEREAWKDFLKKVTPPNLNWDFEKHIGICWVKMKATRVSSAF